jgi:hypothetical protein
VSLSARASPLARGDVARQYLALGFTHILPHGLDHILFMPGIFSARGALAIRRGTGQHVYFRALADAGVDDVRGGMVSLPAKVIEPMIALSIV